VDEGDLGTSFGFPGPLPVERFKGIFAATVCRHDYFSAYPGATTTEIVSAARVEAALAAIERLRAAL
jgi:hypothetical protein